MTKPKRPDHETPGAAKPRVDRTERSSPGSGEDEAPAADLQPDDVERGEPAR